MVQMLLGLALRHGLTLLGGYLLNKGHLDPTAVDSIVGGISTVAGLGLSLLKNVKVVAKLNAVADYSGVNK